MADKTAEQLSALIDGEGEVREWELALRRLGNDAELKNRWERYHLIGEALKNNLPDTLDPGFADRIRQAIDTEGQPVTAPRTGIKAAMVSWYKPITGFALAASVATLALLGLNLTDSGIAPSPGPGPIADAGVKPESQVRPADIDLDSRLGAYLVNHELASRGSIHGVAPYYLRLVGHESKP